MNRSFFLAAAALITSGAALAGCTSSVTCEDRDECGTNAGGGGASSVTTTTTTSSTTSTASSPSTTSVGGGGQGGSNPSTTTVGGGGPGAANAVLEPGATAKLHLATFPLTCADPGQSPPYEQCNWANVEITFPGAMLEAGSIDFADANVTVFMTEAGTPNSSEPGDCGGTAGISGGGSFTGGSVTFGPATETAVTLTVTGFSGYLDATVDGTYPAALCSSP